MKEFLIPVTVEMAGMVAIQAETAEEAIKIAEDHIDELPIPSVKDYVDGSYEIETDPEIVELYPEDEERKKHCPEHFSA